MQVTMDEIIREYFTVISEKKSPDFSGLLILLTTIYSLSLIAATYIAKPNAILLIKSARL